LTRSLNLSPIGNCQVSALLDDHGDYVWACVPRVDGEAVFCSLLDTLETSSERARGIWRIELAGETSVSQRWIRNAPVLVTELRNGHGGGIEIIDFSPRFLRMGRTYRPVAFVRIVRPIAGSPAAPRIRIKLRPASDWGAKPADRTSGSNHIRYISSSGILRLTTDAPVGQIITERMFRVEKSLHFFLGPDEPFTGAVRPSVETMLDETIAEWRHWCRGLATPLEWQDAVIRAAITLKLCQHEETGAIVAALTTSIPESKSSGRNWDYRFCWLRDAYYTVQALNRLGALDVLEGYLAFLRNIVDNAEGGHIQPLYGVGGESYLPEVTVGTLPGYRGMGPVRIGNQAAEQIQHDAFGQIILSGVQAFRDQRLFRMATHEDFASLEQVGERAYEAYDEPDAGPWELRTRTAIHTYSVLMCWAACDRLARAAHVLGLADRSTLWQERADRIRRFIEETAWRPELGRFAATAHGSDLDATLLQLADLGFIKADDERFLATLSALETGLRRGRYLMRYTVEDDFGTPETAFNFCTFWLIEALHLSGRTGEARELFEDMLERRTSAGLLSEDMDTKTGELWGNYPQTYSLVGLINCAMLLSKPWSAVT
jgi:hypothetical protein